MSNSRTRRRLQKKRLAQLTPAELIKQIEEVTAANSALHAMNLALVEVYKAADALLEMRQDDPAYLSVRVALRKRMDTVVELKHAIKENKLATINPKERQRNGTDSAGQSTDPADPTGA